MAGSCEIFLWYAKLDVPDGILQRQAAVLSGDEAERAGRFRIELDRRRFVARRGMLRSILGTCLGIEPRRVVFAAGPFGKPCLSEGLAGGLCFNVSHSAGIAACLVSRGCEVGVDIEHLQPLPDFDSVAEQFFTAAERIAVREASGLSRLHRFYTIWTRKEAVLKGAGLGLSGPINKIEVGGLDSAASCNVELDHHGVRQIWSVRTLTPVPDYLVSVAVLGPQDYGNMIPKEFSFEGG